MRSLVVVGAVALAAAGGASAEVVARGVPDGLLAVAPDARPVVAYLQGETLVIARRVGRDRWRRERLGSVGKGSSLAALATGAAGPAAVIVGPGERTLYVVHRRGVGWVRTLLVRRLDPGVVLGWPGLTLDRGGLPAVAYTRWRHRNRLSQLVLARVTRKGAVRTVRITTNGWPESYVPPPAAPVLMPNGRIHVVESYGISSTVATIEWMPTRKSWTGQFLFGGVGDFPVGPMFAAAGAPNVLYAAFTQAFLTWDEFPVTLAMHGREIDSNFVLDRALTTGLALTPRGAQIAANQWVSAAQLGMPGDENVWAGTITGRAGMELDGWIDGLATVPAAGAQDLLLARPTGISWFRNRKPQPVRLTLAAEAQAGTVVLSGRVHGVRSGRVDIYRERPGAPRERAGTAKLNAGGTFRLTDAPRTRPVLYRAVYTDPASGIPYAKLLRQPVS
jgi:hypothetical protein